MKKYTLKDLQGAYVLGKQDGRAEAFKEALQMLAKVVRISPVVRRRRRD